MITPDKFLSEFDAQIEQDCKAWLELPLVRILRFALPSCKNESSVVKALETAYISGARASATALILKLEEETRDEETSNV